MLKSIVLSVVMANSCPETKLIGFDASLTAKEQESLNHATKRCAELFQDAPCLKSFEKRAEQTFWAICGKATK